MEQKRGISITSTVLQFPYRDRVLNLLDTPGHRDFSEDTYRVLAAADAAIMVLDAAKGIEPQTLKLFEVCRERGLPLLTFINKWDRPGRDPLELLDEIESQLDIVPTPVTWPVGIAGDFRGVVDRRTGAFVRFTRTARGATEAGEEVLDARAAARARARRGRRPPTSSTLLDEVGADARRRAVPQGRADAGVLRLGADELRRAAAARRGRRPRAVARAARRRRRPCPRPLDAPFSAFVFKVQANMDPSHRDRIAFVRVCSGRFERGMVVTHEPTGQAVRDQVRALGVRPGARDDRRGLPRRRRRPRQRHRRTRRRRPLRRRARRVPAAPEFAPEHFVVARVRDTGRFKQFRRGIAQLDEEGVVQVLRDPDLGDQAPMLAAVGPMQFEVARTGSSTSSVRPSSCSPTTYRVARRTDEASTAALRSDGRRRGATPGPTAPATRCSRALLAGPRRGRPARARASTSSSPRARQG